MKRVLITAPYLRAVLPTYEPALRAQGLDLVLPPVVQRLSEDELLKVVHDVDGAIVGDDQWTARVLDAAPRLRVISKWGIGLDAIDLAAASERRIAVHNTPGTLDDPVADTVLAYALAFARRIVSMDRDVRDGKWVKPPLLALGECTFGIIGVGRIGRAVARRLTAFGTRVLGHDPVPPPEAELEAVGIRLVDKDALLRESDFVSLNCNAVPGSPPVIGSRELSLMKPTSYLINTARGSVVDEEALVRALRGGAIAGAGLDVFAHEPLPADSPLRTLPNVLLAPHNANSSPRAWQRVHELSIQNLLRGLAAPRP